MKTFNVTSRWTLLLKIYLPVIWGVSWLTISIAMFMIPEGVISSATISATTTRVLVSSFAISSLGLMVLLFKGLKRVDMAETHFFVTNYIKTFRYTYDSIKSVRQSNYLLFEATTFEFKEGSSFGHKITFINNHRLMGFLKAYPEVAAFFSNIK